MSVAVEETELSAGGRALLPLAGQPRRLAPPGVANACYFRSGPRPGQRKALLQITERCDLHCAHCFVSATRVGRDMTLEQLSPMVMGRLRDAHVANVTLTGGEPFVHPDVLQIARHFVESDIDVTICSNAVCITQHDVDALARLGRVRLNVSLDGMSPDSHGRFRGDRTSFEKTLRNTRCLADAGILKGILCTPNALVHPHEYEELYALARELHVDYLLMNPLSAMGRGVKAKSGLRAQDATMNELRSGLASVRFPNTVDPLTGCIASDIFYVFVNGDIAVCPYLVFAARTPQSQHRVDEFLIGNLFGDLDLGRRLDEYDLVERYLIGKNGSCTSCSLDSACGKGCPAAVVAQGGRIGDVDVDVCPKADSGEISACS